MADDIDEHRFDDGLRWMLDDLILNRLPLMMVVKHIANKRRHTDVAYVYAHCVLDMLN
jgi:hypothetical protein